MIQNQMVSDRDRKKNDYKWYKENIDHIINMANGQSGTLEQETSMTANYKLFNGELDKDDFISFVDPYNVNVKKDDIIHRDLISPKIKVLLGIHSLRPFEWTLADTSGNVSKRKEEAQHKALIQGVINYVTQDIKKEKMAEIEQQLQGRELTEEEQQQVQEQIDQEVQQNMPKELMAHLNENYKDSAEHLGENLINYWLRAEDTSRKFDDVVLHGAIAAHAIMYVGISNDRITIHPQNPRHFAYGLSAESPLLKDAEYQVAWYYMYPSEIVKYFGDELSKKDIEDIYNMNGAGQDDVFYFGDTQDDYKYGTQKVFHVLWRTLRKIGFLTYQDVNTGTINHTIVSSSYSINKEQGDLQIEWRWIPEIVEGWKLGRDKYVGMKPLRGQFKDLNNLYYTPMPYKGVVLDHNLDKPISFVDRMKPYQYLYDVVMWRLENLIYSDKGKKLFMDINMIPQEHGIDLNKWIDYLDIKNIGFMNPNEEGNRGDRNVSNSVKEIDMSFLGDIQKYIYLAQYIENKIGDVVGISKEMEGQIRERQAVSNTRQALLQSNKILQPFYSMIDIMKRDVLEAILENSKVLYMSMNNNEGEDITINYITDDMENMMLKVDPFLLDSATYDVFVNNNDKIFDIRQKVEAHAQAAMQNQMIDMEVLIGVLEAPSLGVAKELLSTAKRELEEKQAQASKAEQAHEDKLHQDKLEEIKVKNEGEIEKEKIRGEYGLQKQAMLSVGFNENKDVDNDKQLDVTEIYKEGKNADIKMKEQEVKKEEVIQKSSAEKASNAIKQKDINQQ